MLTHHADALGAGPGQPAYNPAKSFAANHPTVAPMPVLSAALPMAPSRFAGPSAVTLVDGPVPSTSYDGFFANMANNRSSAAHSTHDDTLTL